jgi:hypothetical protein
MPLVARKLCPACRKRLSAAAFNDSAASADGLARLCRACTNARRRKLAASKGSPPHRSSGLVGALRRGDAGVIRKLIRRHAKLPWGLACECLRAGHLELA